MLKHKTNDPSPMSGTDCDESPFDSAVWGVPGTLDVESIVLSKPEAPSRCSDSDVQDFLLSTASADIVRYRCTKSVGSVEGIGIADISQKHYRFQAAHPWDSEEKRKCKSLCVDSVPYVPHVGLDGGIDIAVGGIGMAYLSQTYISLSFNQPIPGCLKSNAGVNLSFSRRHDISYTFFANLISSQVRSIASMDTYFAVILHEWMDRSPWVLFPG